MEYIRKYASPLGEITLAATEEGLAGLWFAGQKHVPHSLQETPESCPALEDAARWLDLYFSGNIPNFTPKLVWNTTPFRESVWKLLLDIPYGKTVTYGALAAQLGGRMSAQAVGGAVGHNPISLIVPCHRVMGADGSLVGYDGGVQRKAALLALEEKTLEMR